MLYYKLTALNRPIHREIRTKTNLIQTADRWMRHIEAPWSLSNNLWVETMLKNKSVINVRPVSVGIYDLLTNHVTHFPHLPHAVARSRFLAGVTITNISMQLALLYSELDYLTYNPTSRHGTGYTFTWPRPTVEPVWKLVTFYPHKTWWRAPLSTIRVTRTIWRQPNRLNKNHKRLLTFLRFYKHQIVDATVFENLSKVS